MQKSLVIIPTYNEAKNLPILAAEIWAQRIPGLAVLVVDGNSSDGTGILAEELAQERPEEFFALHLSARGGLRRAYIAGFKWALTQGAHVIIQMDCDFSHDPKHIPQMLETIENADLVIGSRYVSGGKLDEKMGAVRYLQSWWANAVYARSILDLGVKDATSGYRCWQAQALNKIDLDAIMSNGYSFQIEMVFAAEKLGFQIIEIPIIFEDRRLGVSKLSWSDKFEAAFRTWEILWRYRQKGPPAQSTNSINGAEGSHNNRT